MEEFETPTYVIDLRDKSTCSRIQSARPSKEIQVLVRPEHDATVEPIVANGALSNNRASFSVVVTRTDGKQQSHSWNYNDVLDAISVLWPLTSSRKTGLPIEGNSSRLRTTFRRLDLVG